MRSKTKRLRMSVWVLVVAAMLLVTACGGQSSTPAPAEPSPPADSGSGAAPAPTPEAPKPHREMVVASWGGQADETFKKAFKPFEEKHNVTIKWVTGNSAENLAKVVASKDNPEFDVALLENTNQYSGSDKGVWATLDPNIVTNAKDLYPQATAINDDGVGFGFIATGLFYKTDEFEKNGWEPPTSWEDLFRPEFCGRVGMNHPNVTYSLYAAMMIGGGSIDKTEAGLQRLGELAKCIPVLEPSSPKLEEKIQLGEYLIGVHASFRVIPLTLKDYPVQFVYPKEGTALMLSMAAPVKNSPNPDLAQEFVNWFISPETQQILMDDLKYGPTNSTVVVSEEYKQLGTADVERVKRMFRADEKIVLENRKVWTEFFDKMMSQ